MNQFFTLTTLVCAIALTAQSSFAGSCLSSAPRTQVELDQQIRLVRQRLAVTSEQEKTMLEIANDAKLDQRTSKIIAGVAVAPGLVISGLSGFFAGAIGGNLPMLALAAGSGVALIGDMTMTIKGLFDKGYTKSEIEKLLKIARENTSTSDFSCSYADLNKRLDEAKDKIYATKLNGSVGHTILNGVTLGNISKSATAELYAISALKRELAQKELKELQSIHVQASVAPRIALTSGAQ